MKENTDSCAPATIWTKIITCLEYLGMCLIPISFYLFYHVTFTIDWQPRLPLQYFDEIIDTYIAAMLFIMYIFAFIVGYTFGGDICEFDQYFSHIMWVIVVLGGQIVQHMLVLGVFSGILL